MVAAVAPSRRQVRAYEPYGAAREAFHSHAPELVLSGPAGTGKSRACLEKLHLLAALVPRLRIAIIRKTRASLTQTALVTYEQEVLTDFDGENPEGVVFNTSDQEYRYPNGSRIVVGGLDKATKIMSSQYDVIYVQEAIELSEDDWEKLTTRLRNHVLPYQQLLADTNPDAPMHWLKQRADAGRTQMLESRHEDNPTVTDDYLSALKALTGVRHFRLYRGLWVAAEGLIWDGWDTTVHLVNHFSVPRDWPRDWVVDFGYTNPFVWQAWAEDPDGRLILYREIYRTQRLVEDHAGDILAAVGVTVDARGNQDWTKAEPRPRSIICDHDAEDRATLERYLNMDTLGAHKSVSPGIQHVATRLKVAGDGKPRLQIMRDALVATDEHLRQRKLPTCTEQEIPGYVWDTANNRKRGEEPLKLHDHGCDALRYMVAHHDIVGRVWHSDSPWG